MASVALAATLFGTAGVARGLGPDGPSSWFVGAWRLVIGGAALVAVAVATRQSPWRPRVRPLTVVAGGLATVGYQLAFFAAVDRVGVGPAAVVTIGTGPVVAGLADIARRSRPPSARWWGGVALAVVGIVVVAAAAPTAASTGAPAHASTTGWLFAVASGSCYPLYGLAAQELMDDRPPLAAIAAVFGAGALLALPVALLSDRGSVGGVPGGTFAMLGWLGFAATALAYACWAAGLARLTLSDTVALTLFEPVAAVLGAAWLLDERVGPVRLAAMAVVLAGIAVATGPGTARAPAVPG